MTSDDINNEVCIEMTKRLTFSSALRKFSKVSRLAQARRELLCMGTDDGTICNIEDFKTTTKDLLAIEIEIARREIVKNVNTRLKSLTREICTVDGSPQQKTSSETIEQWKESIDDIDQQEQRLKQRGLLNNE